MRSKQFNNYTVTQLIPKIQINLDLGTAKQF